MLDVLDEPVLVLNRLWQAVNIVAARRAFAVLARGHAMVVHHDGSDHRVFSLLEWMDFSLANPALLELGVVRTPLRHMALPRIILLTCFDRIPCKELRLTRHNIFERDQSICQYCGEPFPDQELNLDHVIPRHRGGRTTWENVVCSCIACNSRKANRLPHEAGMRLRRRPTRPKWRPVISILLGNHDHSRWKDFLDLAYWNVELE